MAKRKAGLNDIIYELDNEDAVLSEDDEEKNPKNPRLQPDSSDLVTVRLPDCDETLVIIDSIDSTTDETNESELPASTPNGGKTSDSTDNSEESLQNNIIEAESTVLGPNITQIPDDIANSPADSDLGVVGCENRTPLVTIKFRDKKMATSYKQKVKAFMLSLIKLHEVENDDLCDLETDLELDVWPEDLLDDEPKMEEDSIFFVDTAPGVECDGDIPRYSQASTLISNIEDKQASPPPTFRRGPICFNCDGAHPLRECPKPRDNARINENRKNMGTRVGRYHVEDEQKYGHLIPGRISGNLRHALGLKRHEIPMHIYRMRQLGYPPGWLEEARISHSGITMFDSTGSAILDPEDEEGEVCEPGSKDKFDIKKILDFPGFNVPTSSRYKEESHLLNQPPMSEEDSKMLMLQMLAPNAMKAYKRKKLNMFPSSGGAPMQEGQAEMELDSGDEATEFPSVPPLPDEAPPPVPPPPSNPPPPPENPPPPPENPPLPPENPPLPPENPPPPPENPPPQPENTLRPKNSSQAEITTNEDDKAKIDESSDDLEVISVTQVKDIPMPENDTIVIDDDNDNKSQDNDSGRNSPSLDDLVYRQQLLLKQLDGDSTSVTSEKDDITPSYKEDCPPEIHSENIAIDAEEETLSTPSTSQTEVPKTPDMKATGHVKTTLYGTPVLNTASPYLKLPSDNNFAKDICDVINFENLPNSTGKYKKICSLLKKVKSEVDRIQDS